MESVEGGAKDGLSSVCDNNFMNTVGPTEYREDLIENKQNIETIQNHVMTPNPTGSGENLTMNKKILGLFNITC